MDTTRDGVFWLKLYEWSNMCWYFQSSGDLEEELKRVTAENKKLAEMLSVMCENYNTLRNHLTEYMRKNPEKELSPSSRKRKSESSNDNNCDQMALTSNNGNSESSSTDEESCKKPREETIKAKVSRVYVRTEASDTSLVRFLTLLDCYQLPFIHSCTWILVLVYSNIASSDPCPT